MTVLKYAFYVCILLASISMTNTSCGDGYFSDANGKCLPCPLHCPFCDSYDKCLSCNNGYWGSICEIPCSYCQNGTSCEKTNGFCLDACQDRFSGILCDVACSEKCSSCSRTNISNCIKCASGRYPSKSCHRVCSECNNMSCNEEGNCTSGCVEGYWGNYCESACSEHCLNKSCHQKSGNCTQGCEGEYTGPRCNNGKETTTTIFVFVGIGPVLIILTVIVVTVVRRERQKHTRSKRQNQSRSPDPKQGDQNVEYCPFIDVAKASGGQVQRTRVKEKVKALFTLETTEQKRLRKLHEIFERFTTRKEEDYQTEFEKLPNILNKEEPSDALQEVLPFTTNVVSVKGQDGKDNTTNASFIKDMTGEKKYIASGGPIDKYHAAFTLFWTMLWQQKCKTIVMLYNLNEKNKSKEQYWPDKGNKYGDWYVKNQDCTKIHEHKCTRRTFDVSVNKTRKKQGHVAISVKQLHYHEWSDTGIADNIQRLLDFRKEVNLATSNESGPLVVLCRNGAGRTGTYIALDMLLKMVDDMTDSVDVEKTKDVDVFACVMHLRKQRINMVETVEQYKFLYQALSYYISRILKNEDRQEKQEN